MIFNYNRIKIDNKTLADGNNKRETWMDLFVNKFVVSLRHYLLLNESKDIQSDILRMTKLRRDVNIYKYTSSKRNNNTLFSSHLLPILKLFLYFLSILDAHFFMNVNMHA